MRGSKAGKDEKTLKTPEKPAQKVLKKNTFEQYAGLKFAAASSFSDISCRNIRKEQNRHFLQFEQYAGLEP